MGTPIQMNQGMLFFATQFIKAFTLCSRFHFNTIHEIQTSTYVRGEQYSQTAVFHGDDSRH